jgi:ubiquinone/menaquinone biosynthesis C-methylase UbiE
MASEYPSSTFVGLESVSAITAASFSKLSSYYSSKIPEPRNAAVLQTSSTLTSLPFPDETFDLVYHKSSFMTPSSQSLCNPLNALNQMIRVLKPGGWLEFMIIEKQWYNLGPITQYMKDSCKYLKKKRMQPRTIF